MKRANNVDENVIAKKTGVRKNCIPYGKKLIFKKTN